MTAKRPADIIYDTAGGIQGTDANHSVIVSSPYAVQIEPLDSGTTVKIQQSIHASASWVDVGNTITDADGATIVLFGILSNLVQVVRTAGTGAVKAFAQF